MTSISPRHDAPEPPLAPGEPAPRRARWHLLYFVLAGFDLLTVGLSLGINHFLTQRYEASIEENASWALRLSEYSKLARVASQANVAANDVFDTRDVTKQRGLVTDAGSRFDLLVDAAEHDASRVPDPDARDQLLASLAAVRNAMTTMLDEAELIFSHFEAGKPDLAGERMATMDRKYAELNESMAGLRDGVGAIQRGVLDAQSRTARSVRTLEFIIGGCVLVMVSLVTLYGHRLSRMVARMHRRDREQMAALREAKRHAEDASNAKSSFLANMSHEIRTPMTAIMGFADLMLDPKQTPSDRVDSVQTIRRQGEHLLTVINDILDFSKIEAGAMTVERIDASPLQIAEDVQSIMRVRAVSKGVALTVDYATALPATVRTDPGRLRQILLNLVGNAIKFTSSGGVRVRVSYELERSLLRFEVTDTGIGMRPDQIERLFLPFTQADESMSRQFGGTGLGLMISKRLAVLLGGDVSVTSQPGKGSTFVISVAVDPVDPSSLKAPDALLPHAKPAEIESAKPVSIGARVLLAEDGVDNQRLIGFHLRRAGCAVDIVENGKLAAERALAADPSYDVIFMDMQMPEMDGYAATSMLRARGYTRPIVSLTAHAMAGEREKCLKAGCDDYLTKPIDPKLLHERCGYWAAKVGAITAA